MGLLQESDPLHLYLRRKSVISVQFPVEFREATQAGIVNGIALGLDRLFQPILSRLQPNFEEEVSSLVASPEDMYFQRLLTRGLVRYSVSSWYSLVPGRAGGLVSDLPFFSHEFLPAETALRINLFREGFSRTNSFDDGLINITGRPLNDFGPDTQRERGSYWAFLPVVKDIRSGMRLDSRVLVIKNKTDPQQLRESWQKDSLLRSLASQAQVFEITDAVGGNVGRDKADLQIKSVVGISEREWSILIRKRGGYAFMNQLFREPLLRLRNMVLAPYPSDLELWLPSRLGLDQRGSEWILVTGLNLGERKTPGTQFPLAGLHEAYEAVFPPVPVDSSAIPK